MVRQLVTIIILYAGLLQAFGLNNASVKYTSSALLTDSNFISQSGMLLTNTDLLNPILNFEITDNNKLDFIGDYAPLSIQAYSAKYWHISIDESVNSDIVIELEKATGIHSIEQLDVGDYMLLFHSKVAKMPAIVASAAMLENGNIIFKNIDLETGYYRLGLHLTGDINPDNSLLVISEDTVVVDSQSGAKITVVLKNSLGQAVTGGSDDVRIASTFGHVSNITDHKNGTYSAFITSPDEGEAIVSFSINGITSKLERKVLFTHGSVDFASTYVTFSPTTILADGVSKSRISLQLMDSFGHLFTDTANFILSASAGSVSEVTYSGNGKYQANIISTNIATKSTLNITHKEETVWLNSATINFYAGSPHTNLSPITLSKDTLLADGVDTALVTIRLYDISGNPLLTGGYKVVVNTNAGKISNIIDHNNGYYTAILTAPETSRTAKISFSIANSIVSDNYKYVVYKPGKYDINRSEIGVMTTTLMADSASQTNVLVQLIDKYGNKLNEGGEIVTVETDKGAVGAVIDNRDGTYKTQFYSGTQTGTASLTFSVNNQKATQYQPVNLVEGVVVPDNSSIEVDSTIYLESGYSKTFITIQLKDAFYNNKTKGGDIISVFSSNGVLSETIDHNNGKYSVWLTLASSAGKDAQVTFAVNGSTRSKNYISVTPLKGIASVKYSVINTSAIEIAADGESMTAISVKLHDTFGHPMSTTGEEVHIITDKGTISTVEDDGGGVYSAILTSSLKCDTANVTFSINDVASENKVQVVFVEGLPDSYNSIIYTDVDTLVADSSSITRVTVQLKDVNGNLVLSGGNKVDIYASGGSLSQITDNGNGSYSATFYGGIRSGNIQLTFSVNEGGISTNSCMVHVLTGEADTEKSIITATPDHMLADGVTTSKIAVILYDCFENKLAKGGDAVEVYSDNGNVSAVSDNSNGIYAANLTSSAIESTATLTFSINGILASKSVQVEFSNTTTSAVKSVLSVDNDTLTANGTSTTRIVIVSKDSLGINLTTGGNDIQILSTAGKISDITDHNDGTYSATLTSPQESGIAILSFVENGILAPQTNIRVYFNAGVVDASRSKVEVSNTKVMANAMGTSTIRIILSDEFGNAIFTGGDSVIIYTTAGEVSAIDDNLNGTYSATLYSKSRIDTAIISFSVNGIMANSTATVYFMAGLPSADMSEIIAKDVELLADGIASTTLFVTLRDKFGNVITSDENDVIINASLGQLGQVKATAEGIYTATLTSQKRTGESLLTFGVNGSAISKNSCKVMFVHGAPDFNNAILSASPTTITANNISKSVISAQLKDIYGNNYASATEAIEFYSPLGHLGLVTSKSSGLYQSVLTSGTMAGISKVGFLSNSDTSNAHIMLRMEAGLPQVENTVIVADTNYVMVDSLCNVPFSIVLKDAFGNQITSGDNSLKVYVNNTQLTDITEEANNRFTGVLKSIKIAGTYIITFAVNGGLISENKTQVVAAPAKADKTVSVIQAAQTVLIANGISQTEIRLQLRDGYGNYIRNAGDSVQMFTSHGSLSAVEYQGKGAYSALLTSSKKAGMAEVTFSVNETKDISNKATVIFSPGLSAPDFSDIRVTPASIVADGVSETVVMVTLKDINGNQMLKGGEKVDIFTTKGQLGTITDNGDGTYSNTLKSDTISGLAQLSFAVNNSTLSSNTATASFVAGSADVRTCQIRINRDTVIANGIDYAELNVKLFDKFDNALKTAGDSIQFFATIGTVFDLTDNLNGTYNAKVRSYRVFGLSKITFSVNGITSPKNKGIEFVKAIAHAASSEITAQPNTIVADGKSESVITVSLKEKNTNTIHVGGDTVKILTDRGEISSVTDNDDGSYTAVLVSDNSIADASLSFSVNGIISDKKTKVKFIAGDCLPDNSTINVEQSDLTANGRSRTLVNVALFDAYSNPLNRGGDTVRIVTDNGIISAISDKGNGNYEALLTSDTVVGRAKILFSVNGTFSERKAVVDFIPGSASALQSSIALSDTVAVSDSISAIAISIKLADAFGNRIPTGGDSVTITTTYGHLAPVIDNQDGTYLGHITATYYGWALIGFMVNGNASDTFLKAYYKPTDKDGDGLFDDTEDTIGTDPFNVDTDSDGVTDFTEVEDNTDPLKSCDLVLEHQTISSGIEFWNTQDCDEDGILNSFEKEDSDGDKIPDYFDSNDDNDALETIDEMPDPDGNGNPDDAFDADGDSLPDYLDKNNVTSGLPDDVEVYNTITPNNDGLNDVFTIRNIEKYPDNRLVVVNRLGDVVFDLRGIDNCSTFDGKKKGSSSLLPSGVYFYYLTYVNESGDKKNREGFIFLNY